MMATTKWIKRMAKEPLNGLQEIDTQEHTKTTKEMDLVKCTGLTDLFTKGNGEKEFSTDKESWSSLMVLSKKAFLRITFS